MARAARRTRIRALVATAAVSLLGLAVTTTGGAAAHAAAATSGSGCPPHLDGSTKVGHLGGVIHPKATTIACGAQQRAGDPATGTPPLLFHGGPVMGTRWTGPVVITPIYWTPPGHPIDRGYRRVINGYLRNVAAASGQHTNVYSTLNEYFGKNGSIRYDIRRGQPLVDHAPLPADGCQLAAQDTTKIYADNSGYNSCLDDAQVITETDRVVDAHHLRRDYGHIYVMFLPKHVESCFFAGSTTTVDNFCTINYQLSAAYCAYHSQAPSSTVYANMPYPVYTSPVGYTCGSDGSLDTLQSPNGNPDADVEISPTSHEIMEAITDPDTVTGWFDSSDFENGDECAYVYGPTRGAPGRMYNQVIRGRRYLTQEEFSNLDFFRTGGGCLQSE